MGQLGACKGRMAPGPCRPGVLLVFTSRHAHLSLQKALKFNPLGTKHASLREDLKSFSLIDSRILSRLTLHLCGEVPILARGEGSPNQHTLLRMNYEPFIRNSDRIEHLI